MNTNEFIFTDILVEPYDRIKVGDVVVFDDYPDRSFVEMGVVTEIHALGKRPDEVAVAIAYSDTHVAVRSVNDLVIGKMKKITNINNFKEDK